MANLNDGVGKKIVEALKKQSELETSVTKKVSDPTGKETVAAEDFDFAEKDGELTCGLLDSDDISDDASDFALDFDEVLSSQADKIEDTKLDDTFNDFMSHPEKENDDVPMPGNILILKKLITQLPSGVTRHTGAQIIKQTMEALGISMKSVLTEAQEVQSNLKESSKECQAMIQEYKRKIALLEKQTQNHQKQYNALNDLISLFIQTSQ